MGVQNQKYQTGKKRGTSRGERLLKPETGDELLGNKEKIESSWGLQDGFLGWEGKDEKISQGLGATKKLSCKCASTRRKNK